MEAGEQENIKLANFRMVPVDSSTWHLSYLRSRVCKIKITNEMMFQWDF